MMRKMVLAALAATMLSGIAYADVMVVDRGLPTANLNNAAGNDRSNVSWAFTDNYFAGDTFTLGGPAGTQYTIDHLRTWVVSDSGLPISATLYTGSGAGANLASTSTAASFTSVTYGNGETYQTLSNAFRPLYQVDFTGLNIVAMAGDTISFGVDGLTDGRGYFYNHASNAALSGSTQDSANNLMAYYYHDGAGATFDGDFDSNQPGVWDKSSDINVQVFANVAAVPEPATWGMMIVGFGAIGGTMRRRKVAFSFA